MWSSNCLRIVLIMGEFGKIWATGRMAMVLVETS